MLSEIAVDGKTLLHLAVINGHGDLATFLIEKGATVDSPDNAGQTPLHWVAKSAVHIIRCAHRGLAPVPGLSQ